MRNAQNPFAPISGSRRGRYRNYLYACLGIAVTTGAAFAVDRYVPHANLSLVFLLGVLAVAAWWGLGPSLLAAVLSFLAFNFFFTTPYHTLAVASDSDVITLLSFLVVATVTGYLAGRMHDEFARNQSSLRRVTALLSFAKRMAAAADTDSVARELVGAVSAMLASPVTALLPDGEGNLQVTAHAPPERRINLSLAKIEAVWRDASPASRPGLHFVGLGTARGPIGLLAIEIPDLEAEQREMVQALCDQAAIAIERTRLVSDLEDARVVTETEQLRSALLSSVSHDLRTPLASIIGSASTLIEYGATIRDEDRRELLHTVQGEAERLNRYIQNLLDMTRLGHGGLELKRDWVDVGDVVKAAVDRLETVSSHVRIETLLDPDLPLLFVHGAFMEQALVNILDNAIRFSPPESTIRIRGRKEDERVLLDVCDQGPGIPEEERERIFDMFYSLSGSDRHAQGTGLGLAICRGLIGAHGGQVTAGEGPGGRGTCLHISLPVTAPEQT